MNTTTYRDNRDAFSDQFLATLSQIEQVWAEAEISPAYVEALRQGLTLSRIAAAQYRSEAQQSLLSIWRLPGLCSAVAGKTEQEALPVTAAWLLLYAAAHTLDDLEDGDFELASSASVGASIALNVSTGWIISAGCMLNKLEALGINREIAPTIRSDFYYTILRMCTGQHADLTASAPTLQECWQIADLKSASFFALAGRAGSRIASRNLRQIEMIGQFGHHIGMLIQINDDCGDLWPTSGERSDLATNAKWSLPIAYAMTVLAPNKMASLQAHLQQAATDIEAAAEARRLVIKSGALCYLAVEAERHRQQALSILETVMLPSSACQELLALVNALTSLPAT